jgi:hypothetical protein
MPFPPFQLIVPYKNSTAVLDAFRPFREEIEIPHAKPTRRQKQGVVEEADSWQGVLA